MFSHSNRAPLNRSHPSAPASAAAHFASARRVDLFLAWVLAAHDAGEALQAWTSSAAGERREAHAVYWAALDREERAATMLATPTA
jgi:hypothetical protein